jgi:hypothetical protein
MFQVEVIQKLKTHILYSINIFLKSCRLCDNVEKYCTARQATENNMAHMRSMLHDEGYKHTHRICNTLLFHYNSGYTNAPRCSVYMYIARLVGVYLQPTYKPERFVAVMQAHTVQSRRYESCSCNSRWTCWWFQIATLGHSDTICWTSIYGQLQVAWFENETIKNLISTAQEIGH